MGAWGTAECLRGDYSFAEQMPDKNLGVSMRKLHSLQQIPLEDTRRYGVPSIRHDRQKPSNLSVSNTENWGDEVDAKGLLYPEKYDFDGVPLEMFKASRTLPEIKVVFDRMGADLTDEQYERLSEQAQREFGILSVDSFRHVLNSPVSSTAESTVSRDAIPEPVTYANPMDAYRGVPPLNINSKARDAPLVSGRRESPFRTVRNGGNTRAAEEFPLRPDFISTKNMSNYGNTSTIRF